MTRPLRSSPRPLVVGAALVLAIVALPAAAGLDESVVALADVYAVTVALAGGAWYWRARPLTFQETVGVAAVAVVLLTPVTALLLVDSSPYVPIWTWGVFQSHLQLFVPMVFVLPLGAATTWRQRLDVVAAMLMPSLYELFDWFVLHPERFSQGRMGRTPEDLLVITVVGFLLFAALGSPFALLGRQLARESGPVQYVARRVEALRAA